MCCHLCVGDEMDYVAISDVLLDVLYLIGSEDTDLRLVSDRYLCTSSSFKIHPPQ